MHGYDHKSIEKKWQKRWKESGLYKSVEVVKKKCYVLGMFPYPSGDGLHVGHSRVYTASDIYSRYKRMSEYSVLHPIGWDAFGLPAENYAIKNKVHPRVAVEKNIVRFRDQLERLGLSYDWDREINTTDPEYYKWTQWIFLKLLERGLAYESNEPINWCPKCLTGLANEDLDGDRCERCDSIIEKKPVRQWVLKITDYAERMLGDLELLPEWPTSVKELQKNWIGKRDGAEIGFPIVDGGTKPNFLILHGYTATSQDDFHPWLKRELENKGYKVQVPDLPNTATPSEKEQVEYVLKNCALDENTILVGHSLGAVVARRVLEQYGKPIRGLLQIASAVSPDFYQRQYQQNFTWKENSRFLKTLASWHIILSDTKEPNRAPYLRTLADMFEAELRIETSVEEHFVAKEEPEILNALFPKVNVFTTRPDTVFGATYFVLSPEHQFVGAQKGNIENWSEVQEYVEKARGETDIERVAEGREKTGVELKGLKAVNPATKEEIPIYVADYVLAHYGTGAIMAVPAHDERDMEFAKKHNLPVRPVVQGVDDADVYTGAGKLINSGEFDGMDSEASKVKIVEKVDGKMVTTYKLRDWVFSRQRYWGEPIPVIHCEKCGAVGVPEEDLPVLLPDVKSYEPTGTGESPLAGIEEWVNVKCPKCGGAGKRETNTMPQWAGSSWYYLRFMDPKNEDVLVAPEREKYWAPVDMYVGGMEHSTRHLIYARFWHKFLYDIGIVSTIEPFTRLQTVGLVCAEDGRKMSKRWRNVVNPDDVVERLGADSLRVYEMFMGPFDTAIDWSSNSLVGSRRFMEKVWRLSENISEDIPSNDASRLTAETIKKVGHDIEAFKFNTAISQMMILVNSLEKEETVSKDVYGSFLKLLAPFAPHISEELWEKIGNSESVHTQIWPKSNESALSLTEIEITVQVEGKTRGQVVVSNPASEDDVMSAIKKMPTLQKWFENGEPSRVIYVPNRLLNLVFHSDVAGE
jgi:leucyl-tRNA synthetase